MFLDKKNLQFVSHLPDTTTIATISATDSYTAAVHTVAVANPVCQSVFLPFLFLQQATSFKSAAPKFSLLFSNSSSSNDAFSSSHSFQSDGGKFCR